MPLPERLALAFDDFVIDFAGRRLLRGEAELALEPKAFAVLALLAGAPGRAFSRDEILDAVWGHRHVTPGVLNRVMTLLRHALDEDGHNPHRLRTLHGMGYRFDLPTLAPSLELPVVTSEATVEGDTPGSLLRRSTEEVMTPPRRLPRAAFWLLPLLIVLAVAAGYLWSRADQATVASTPVKVAALPTLVVLPLKPIGETTGGSALADGLGEELINSLAQIQGLRVIARESTTIAATESSDPAALAKRLGVSHALEGSLQQVGQQLRIRLRLIDAKDGNTLWAKDFDRDASEVLALQREIAQAVASSLTLRLGLSPAPAKSGDAEFLRRYLAARALADRRDIPPSASVEPAEAEYRALLRERPADARLHAALALALAIRAARSPELGAGLRVQALREAALSLRLDPSLAEPYAILGSEDCRRDHWESCMVQLAKARSLAPSNSVVRYAYATQLARLGYLHQAETEGREALARDPINTLGYFFLARILDTQGRHEEAHAQLERASAGAIYARWFNALWRRDYRAALRIAESYDMPGAADSYGPLLKPSAVLTSRAFANPGLWPQAIAASRRFEHDTGRMDFGLVLGPDAQAHAAELIAGLAATRKRDYSSYDLLLWTRDLAFLRRDPAFHAYLRDTGILAYWRKHGFPAQCRQQGDGAACE